MNNATRRDRYYDNELSIEINLFAYDVCDWRVASSVNRLNNLLGFELKMTHVIEDLYQLSM